MITTYFFVHFNLKEKAASVKTWVRIYYLFTSESISKQWNLSRDLPEFSRLHNKYSEETFVKKKTLFCVGRSIFGGNIFQDNKVEYFNFPAAFLVV